MMTEHTYRSGLITTASRPNARLVLLICLSLIVASPVKANQCVEIFSPARQTPYVIGDEKPLLELAHLKLAAYEAAEKNDTTLAESLNADFERLYRNAQSLGLPMNRVHELINRDRHLNAEARLKEKARLHEMVRAEDGLRPWRAIHQFRGERFKNFSVIQSALMNPDGTRVVSNGMKSLTMTDAVTKRELFTLRDFPGEVQTVFSPDGRKALAISYEEWRLFDTTSGEIISKGWLRSMVQSADFHPDGSQIALGLVHNGALLIDLATGKERRPFNVDTTTVSSRYSPDGRHIVFRNRGFRVIDTKKTKEQYALTKGWAHDYFNPEFSADGKRVIVAGKTSLFSVDIETGKRKQIVRGVHDSPVISIGIKPGTEVLAYGSLTGDFIAWDMNRKKKLADIKGPERQQSIRSIAFNRDGTRMVTTWVWDRHLQREVTLWDTSSANPSAWKIIARLENSEDVFDARFSPDGNSILTSSGALWERTPLPGDPQ